MRRLLATLLLMAPCATAAVGAAPDRPNVVFILADDLGFGDLGVYGQKKFKTPSIDRIAREGMTMRVHYSGNAVCAPSRCVLMTGKNPGHAFIRDNRQHRPGGEGQWPVPPGELSLPITLDHLGYATGAFGKWGLGAPGTTGEPLKQGIDRFFGYNCQAVAHNYYPTSLWDDDKVLPLDNPRFSAHQKLPEGVDPAKADSYATYSGKDFAPDRIGEQALRFVRENKDRPFFLYYPTTVPHLALQVPDDSLAEYEEKYPEEPYDGTRGYLPHRTPRAAYAAMVARMDREVGRVLDLIDELGLAESTIVVFTSDNGPLYDRLGGTDTDFFGSRGGFRGRKGSLYEGGVRVPCLVRWTGRIAAGSTSDRATGFEDWLPTLLDLIGAHDDIPAGVDGISFAPTLLGESQPPRPFLYREFPSYGGQQSVRVGDWKAVRQGLNPPARRPLGASPVELYDLGADPAESKDVADAHPDVVAKLSALMAEQHVRSPDFPIRGLDAAKSN